MRLLGFFFVLCICHHAYSQDRYSIRGELAEMGSFSPLTDYEVSLYPIHEINYADARFLIPNLSPGAYRIEIQKTSYHPFEIVIEITNQDIDLGPILLQPIEEIELSANSQLVDLDALDARIEQHAPMGILKAYKTALESQEAFHFSSLYYSPEGLDRSAQEIYFFGIKLNRFRNQRVQWANLGGLSPLFRHSHSFTPLQYNSIALGSIGALQNIAAYPSEMRKGLHFRLASSNKSYTYGINATYVSPLHPKWQLAWSSTVRWAESGYIDGTPYLSNAMFAALEFQPQPKHRFLLAGIYADRQRGRSEAITQEVYELLGPRYNSNWGYQQGHIRNAREERIREPFALLQYRYLGNQWQLNSNVFYQSGSQQRDFLGYYNTPNPNPVYYRNLPSYFIQKNPANFDAANTAKSAILKQPQLHWQSLYQTNRHAALLGESAYLLETDVWEEEQLQANIYTDHEYKNWQLHTRLDYRMHWASNFAKIKDLLGNNAHKDIDYFQNTKNNSNDPNPKTTDERFKYHYDLHHQSWDASLRLQYQSKRWNAFGGFAYGQNQLQRIGHFKNEKYPESSMGSSTKTKSPQYTTRIGGLYFFNNRSFLSTAFSYQRYQPKASNLFPNLRYHNQEQPIGKPKSYSGQLLWQSSTPKWQWQTILYYHLFTGGNQVRNHYVETGFGSYFLREIQTEIQQQHLGIRMGIGYQPTASLQLQFATAIGNHQYHNNPNISISLDDASTDNQPLSLGTAAQKGLRLSNGPQTSTGLSLRYRAPKYWWIASQISYFDQRFVQTTAIRRTKSFWQNPDTKKPFTDITAEKANELLQQEQLPPVYLLQLQAGKSWLYRNTYIGLFASVQNLFNQVYKTGGYEQARKANYQALLDDHKRNAPLFGNKYWFGRGRTFFIQLSISF
ncbi:MAG: hypothetical protein OIF50_14060 [Flavobacteriaceae bacterium]|nr:hypothetical protein [Flavobacteriaceae bacterium]